MESSGSDHTSQTPQSTAYRVKLPAKHTHCRVVQTRPRFLLSIAFILRERLQLSCCPPMRVLVHLHVRTTSPSSLTCPRFRRLALPSVSGLHKHSYGGNLPANRRQRKPKLKCAHSNDALQVHNNPSISYKGAQEGKQSRCGKCRRYMKYVAAKPSRLHCSSCDETYSLPQNGNIKVYKELRCPLDEFELLLWSGGAKGKSFPFCPYCYNNPPFRDMRKGLGCNACTHPSCSHALNANGVSACFECDGGVLVLDPSSGPKWKLACNRCDVIIHIFEDAYKVSVDEDTCDECGCQLISVEYKADKTKLPEGASDATGCIFCDAQFSSLVEKHHAIVRRHAAGVGGRGAGRGGGRGRGGRGRGRSRGRGKGKPKDKMAQLAAYFV